MSRTLIWLTYILMVIGGFAVAVTMAMDILYSVDLRGRPSDRFMVMAGLGLPIFIFGIVGWAILTSLPGDSDQDLESN